MYPLFELGPLRLSSGGLMLVAAAYLWGWLFERTARRRGGEALGAHAAAVSVPALIAAALGARLWYGMLSLDLYGSTPSLFLAPRLAELAWPGALLGGAAAGWLWAHRRAAPVAALADAAALALPPAMALAALGMLLSGEAFGMPTSLPWAVPLFGALRHPTQLYYALAALGAWLWLQRAAAAPLPAGALAARLLVANGLAMLLVEALRADALTLADGLRATQIFGLVILMGGLWRLRPAE
jgi:phosphatidylglycerol---prolipoprotein diacylglyceryl transferase